ncbi:MULTISPECIES: hypothetical protein [Halorussus]|uniref:hypothetical protein n=1 Tax=Halorussus TaxID=1070314 RepID=UPI000E210246|nr:MULTISPECIES: hypothetical protein [Halorussus]NHN58771.1 hypothetical protein [Halorussus sp. JP-T4]
MSSDWDTAGNTVTQSEDPGRRRVVHEWVFLTGNRMRLAGGLVLAALVAFGLLELWVAFDRYDVTAFLYLTAAVIGGNFTLITIVLSINQLVISQQLSAPGELEAEIKASTDYRDTVTGILDRDTTPATPAAFLEVLFNGVNHSLRTLAEYGDASTDAEAEGEIDDVVTSLGSHIDTMIAKLEESNQTVFSALVLTLNTNYSEEITEIARLKAGLRDAGGAPPEVRDELDTLVTRLKQIDVARQYLKTLYMQQELARLSRRLLYVGGPTIFASISLLALAILGDTGPLDAAQLAWLFPFFVALSVAPLAVLVSFILRLSVVAERTVAVTPFTTSTQEDPSVVDITQD